jgi:hypothetical protein
MRRVIATYLIIFVGVAAFADARGEESSSILSGVTQRSPGELTPEGRLVVGRGEDYAPSTEDEAALSQRLRTSMKARRDFAWRVVEQMLKPKKVKKAEGDEYYDVPLWQTWYEGMGTELNPIFKLYFQKLSVNPGADRQTLADEAIEEYATKNLLSTLTNANFQKVLKQHEGMNLPAEFGGRGFTLFSPSFVKHLLREAQGVEECNAAQSGAEKDPPSPTNFSYCIEEFPRSAVMVKSTWNELADGVFARDTGASAMTDVIENGTWPALDPSSPSLKRPDEKSIYTNISTDGTKYGLTAIHFSTKDVREWVWISLWWDPDAKKDYGADRPAFLDKYNGGVWKNYKMCVVTAFAEDDPQPWKSYTGPMKSLGDSIQSAYKALEKQIAEGAKRIKGMNPSQWGDLGPWPAPYNKMTSWCSNPNLEFHAGNGRTSCIGCHQLSYTERGGTLVEFSDATRGIPPQFARAKVRMNFPADFAWSFKEEFRFLIGDARAEAQFEWPPRPGPSP